MTIILHSYQNHPNQICFRVEGQANVVPPMRSKWPEVQIRMLQDVTSRSKEEITVGVDCPELDETGVYSYLDDISSVLVAGGAQNFEVKPKAEGETLCPVPQDRVIIWYTNIHQGGASGSLLISESESMYNIKVELSFLMSIKESFINVIQRGASG